MEPEGLPAVMIIAGETGQIATFVGQVERAKVGAARIAGAQEESHVANIEAVESH